MHVYPRMHVRGKLVESFFFFLPHVDPRNQTGVIRRGGRCLDQLIWLASSLISYFQMTGWEPGM